MVMMPSSVHAYKKGDIVIIDGRKYRVISYDAVASRVYNKVYYKCRLIGRSCVDSYPKTKMKST